jgi:hypothetical protein
MSDCLTLPPILPRTAAAAPRPALARAAAAAARCTRCATSLAAAACCCRRCCCAAGVPDNHLPIVAAPDDDVRVQGVVLERGDLVGALQNVPAATANALYTDPQGLCSATDWATGHTTRCLGCLLRSCM